MTERYGKVGLWDESSGPVVTGSFALVIGGLAGVGAGILIYRGPGKAPAEDADSDAHETYQHNSRVIYRWAAVLLALTAFGVTYFSAMVAVKTNEYVETAPGVRHVYMLLDHSAMTGANAVGIPLTIAGGGVMLVNGCLYLKARYKRSES